MTDREPGDDDWSLDDEDDEPLVSLGALTTALSQEDERRAREAAQQHLLRATKTPPHAIEAERAVVGAVLLDPSTFDAAMAEGLRAQHFARPNLAKVFAVLADMRSANKPITVELVVEELLSRGQIDDVGGSAALASLEAALPSTEHVGAHARLIVEKAQLRSLIDVGTDIVASAFSQTKTAAAIIHKNRERLSEVERGVTTTRGLTGDALAKAIMAGIRKEGEVPTYIPIGVPVVDDTVGGVPRGGMMVIAAERKTGKSTMVGHIALNLLENGYRVVIWSFEMQGHEIGGIVAGQHAGIHLEQNKILSPQELSAMDVSSAYVSDALHIESPASLTVEELAAQMYAYKHRHSADVFIVENMQGIRLSTNLGQLQADHAHVSNTMRRTMKELQVAGIFMSQIKTQTQEAKAAGKSPDDSSVPQTNAWGDDVYLMATMSRFKLHADAEVRRRTKFQIVANRINGETPHAYMKYDPRSGRVRECLPHELPLDEPVQEQPQRKTQRRSAKPVAFGASDRRIHGVDDVPEEPPGLMDDHPRGRG